MKTDWESNFGQLLTMDYCGSGEESLAEDDNTHKLREQYAIVWLLFPLQIRGKDAFCENANKRMKTISTQLDVILFPATFLMFCFL